MYAGFSNPGGVDTTAYLVGSWEEVIAVKGGTDYQIGNCPEGSLEISREYYRHEDTTFPRRMDMIIPIRAGMKFMGNVEEIHEQNVSMLLGQTLTPTGNYIYHGNLEQSYFFTLRGYRRRVSDSVAVEFCMWKCLVVSTFTLGSGDEVQGVPMEVEALDDTDGDYGGSSTAPLGWLWVPTEAGG